jgi:hypothetical protein
MTWCAMKGAALGLSPHRTHATRRRWRSLRSVRRPAAPTVERRPPPGASVRRQVNAPGGGVAITPRSAAAEDSRRPSSWCPESRRPWPRRRSVNLRRRCYDPPQASRASGHRKDRRTAARSHARDGQAPVRKSAVAFRASPTPRAAVHERVRRRRRDRREYPRARPPAEHYRRRRVTTLVSQLEKNPLFRTTRSSERDIATARAMVAVIHYA